MVTVFKITNGEVWLAFLSSSSSVVLRMYAWLPNWSKHRYFKFSIKLTIQANYMLLAHKCGDIFATKFYRIYCTNHLFYLICFNLCSMYTVLSVISFLKLVISLNLQYVVWQPSCIVYIVFKVQVILIVTGILRCCE